jgi:hypothetical protein
MEHMATAIYGENVSVSWLNALELLLREGRDVVNLAVSIRNSLEEDPRIRGILDRFIASRRADGSVEPVSTVANTIFPAALYIPRLGSRARSHLYEMSEIGRPVSRRRNHLGTYFERLVAWPLEKETLNQLERTVTRIRGLLARGRKTDNSLELGVFDPRDDEELTHAKSVALSVYRPGRDNRIMGFPCLSHISLSLMDGELHMTAVYRNHEFIRRAYGNYLGLGRVLSFLARESGCEVGELMCISSHADPEFRRFGRGTVGSLVEQCRASMSTAVQAAGG